MSIKLKIITKKPDKIESSLKDLQKILESKSKSMATSSYFKTDHSTFLVTILFPVRMGADWIVRKTFQRTWKKIDSEIIIEKIK